MTPQRTAINYTFKVVVADSGCWLYQGRLNGGGYGPHRKMWELVHNQPVPRGLEIDHLCRTPACIFPEHLEPVLRSVNVRRGNAPVSTHRRFQRQEHCKNGHDFAPGNTRMAPIKAYPYVQRICKICARNSANKHRQKKGFVSKAKKRICSACGQLVSLTHGPGINSGWGTECCRAKPL